MRIGKITIHQSVTIDRVMEMCDRYHTTLDNPGICILCGCEAEGVEPDARRYECEACGAECVYGAEELLLRMA